MTLNRQQYAIKALGKIEGFKSEIEAISAALDAAPLWKPISVLKKQCEETLQIMSDLKKRFDLKLVVTLIGTSGSGKSTLFNALAGADDISIAGDNRPTTRSLIALCGSNHDAQHLIEHLNDNRIQIRFSALSSVSDQVILIDTPDTDSTELQTHIPMVIKAIELSDVLIAVFNSENPKRRDYADFLAPYIRRFKGESLVCVMNKCDRQDEHELKEVIVPEFMTYIRDAWEYPVDRVLCVSARKNLKNPHWDSKALPKHDFDQFDELKKMVSGTFAREGFVIDRRIEHAQNLKEFLKNEIRAEVEKDQTLLADIRSQIADAEKSAIQSALQAFSSGHPRQPVGVNVLLYQKLSQRWLGPVGWLITLWTRILIFGAGIVSIFRFGNPLRQLLGMASSLWHYKESKAALAETESSEQVHTALRHYRLSMIRTWPDLAESLVKSRFDPSVRQVENVFSKPAELSEELTAIWNDALDSAVEEYAGRLSGLWLQLVFNLPVIGILAYAGWITSKNFFIGKYMTSDFFLHAFLTIAIVLFLCFFVFQGCARLIAGSERITQKAFENVKKRTEEWRVSMENPLAAQVRAVLNLV